MTTDRAAPTVPAALLTQIDEFCAGAQRAADAGDLEAFVELITAAAGLLQVAKSFQSSSAPPLRPIADRFWPARQRPGDAA